VKRLPWSLAPVGATPVQKKNFIYVQLDGVAIGLVNAASPFLPVFLTRLGANNFEVGLLTAMPAITGLLLALVIGRFLQSRRNIVPWYSFSRLLTVLAYTMTGLVTFFVPPDQLVKAVLIIWAFTTLPQAIVSVCFTVVMNSVAGPGHRYELMSRRWSVLGLTTSIFVALAGRALDQIGFPFNYQIVFIGLSLGGVLSFLFSNRIDLPDNVVVTPARGLPLDSQIRDLFGLVWREKGFLRLSIQQFIFFSGTALSIPLFPLYYVRVVQANNAWIGAFSMAQSAVLLLGYFLWTRWSRLRGGRFVLLWTTFGLTLYPLAVALTQSEPLLFLIVAAAGIFQAGLDLVFFDELLQTFPSQHSATFVSVAQSMQYLATIFAPLIGTWLSTFIGIGGALIVSSALRFTGFALFAWWKTRPAPAGETSLAAVNVISRESKP
jgi:Na+/melibiose symporter-like transporter